MPLHRSLHRSLAATLALTLAVPAMAQDMPLPGDPERGGAMRTAPGDADGDGIVTWAEAEADAAARFAERDANAAGKLDASEMPRRGGPGAPRGAATGRMDANNDGAIDQAEFMATARTRFDRMDTDRDGRITPVERKAAMDAMRARWQSMRGDGSPGGEGGPPPMPQD